MWPWGHLALGYLCYLPYEYRARGDASSWLALVALAVGTQFPDLVDKPLAWTFGVLPSGRSLAHSVLALVVVCGAVYLLCRHAERVVPSVAFGIGYASHLVGDSVGHVLAGEYEYLVFLVWPLLGAPPYGDEGGFLSHFANLRLTSFLAFQFALCAVAFGAFLVVQYRLGRAEH
ncbi:metal-dependent hydrolase (plasmid) [Halarchaeum sp. CBA1220]|uniref:metal-dependent hydrolase n=1 Tax=Halarchaeum sp. CBA1220 TaxID=1853682 RepID=UPI000F3AA0DB|nr:metal-dependent hydrolase [Halarchaeum sp. CBA1220]QLC35179.1 metal-dependent hydrolase [Halarchaeum sp. CBA1220]